MSTRIKRHIRIRKKVVGTKIKPRLSIFRTLNHIYAQIIDDETPNSGKTLLSVSSRSSEIKNKIKNGGNINAATTVGLLLAKKCSEKGFKELVFDRGGYKYHGRVKALAESLREGGLKF